VPVSRAPRAHRRCARDEIAGLVSDIVEAASRDLSSGRGALEPSGAGFDSRTPTDTAARPRRMMWAHVHAVEITARILGRATSASLVARSTSAEK